MNRLRSSSPPVVRYLKHLTGLLLLGVCCVPVLAMLVGCGSSTQSATSDAAPVTSQAPSTTSPEEAQTASGGCGGLTTQEVAVIIPGAGPTMEAPTSCEWSRPYPVPEDEGYNPTKEDANLSFIDFTTGIPNEGITAAEWFTREQDQAEGIVEPISGLGEKAFFDTSMFESTAELSLVWINGESAYNIFLTVSAESAPSSSELIQLASHVG